uniref:RPW8 domain-containing protein n=1 Tax=Haemonchus contortus TaxID=6289 RepID=A0A7I4YF92_HAECO
MGTDPAKAVLIDGPELSSSKSSGLKPSAPARTQTRIKTFMSIFTWERFKKNPDLYRKAIAKIVDDQIRHTQTVTNLLQELEPELRRQERELGLLNIKCQTLYERLRFIRQLRENADDVIRNFDLSTGKTLEEVVAEAPPLLKNAVRLHQIRWRNANASSKWQKDFEKAEKDLAIVRERFKNGERELEEKRNLLEMFKKILAIKDEFTGLSDDDKVKKMKSVLGISAPLVKEEEKNSAPQVELERTQSTSSTPSDLSEDESCWDELWEGNAQFNDSAVEQGSHGPDN